MPEIQPTTVDYNPFEVQSVSVPAPASNIPRTSEIQPTTVDYDPFALASSHGPSGSKLPSMAGSELKPSHETSILEEFQPYYYTDNGKDYDNFIATMPQSVQDKANRAIGISAALDVKPQHAFDLEAAFTEMHKNDPIPEKLTRDVARGIGRAYEAIGGYLLSKGVDNPAVRDVMEYGKRLYRSNPKMLPRKEYEWSDLLDFEYLSTNFAENIPTWGSLLVASIIGGYVAAPVAGVLGLGMFGKLALSVILGSAVATPFESAMEAGNTYLNLLNKGKSHDEAKLISQNVYDRNLAMLGLTNVASLGLAFMPLRIIGKAGASVMTKRILSVLVPGAKAVGVMGSEGGQERYQELIQMQAEGEDIGFFDNDPRLNEATGLGMTIGLGLNGVGSVWNALTTEVTKDMPDPLKKVYNEEKAFAKASGLTEQQAELKALDAVAEIPEGQKHIEDVIKGIKEQIENPNFTPEVQEEVQEDEEAPIPEFDEHGFYEKDKALTEKLIAEDREPTDEELDDLIYDYSDKAETPKKQGPITADQARSVFAPLVAVVAKSGHKVVFHNSPDEMPDSAEKRKFQEDEQRTGRRVMAAYVLNTDTSYIFTYGAESMNDILREFIHESIGHAGLYKFMGEELNPFLDYVLAHPKYGEQVKKVAKERGIDFIKIETRRQAAKEWFAGIAEREEIQPTLMTRLIVAFKNALRRMGIKAEMLTGFSDSDIAEIIRGSRAAISGRNVRSASFGKGAVDYSDAPKKPEESKSAKTRIRAITGQTQESEMIPERVALKEGMRKAAQAAKKAYSEGKKAAIAEAKKAGISEESIKARIRRVTGQTQEQKLTPEYTAFKNSMRRAAQAAKVAYSAGKKDAIEASKIAKEESVKIRVRRITGQTRTSPPTQEHIALREVMRKSMQASVAAYRAGKHDAVAKLVEERKAHKITYKEKQKAEQAKRTAIKNIQKMQKKMGGKIAVDYQKRIKALMSGLDFKKPTEAKLEELNRFKNYIKEKGIPLGANPKHLKELERLIKVPILEFSSENVAALENLVKFLYENGRIELEMKLTNDQWEREKALKELVVDTHNLDPKIKDKTKLTWRESALVTTLNNYVFQNYGPRVADMIDGFGKYKKANARLVKGFGARAIRAKFNADMQALTALEKIKAIDSDEITEESRVRMVIVRTLRQGGRSQVRTLLDHYKLKEIPVLTEKEEKIIKIIQDTLAENKPRLVATFEKLNNKIFPEVPNYYSPFKYVNAPQIVPDTNVLGATTTTHTFQGFTNERVEGVEELLRVDIFQVLQEALHEQHWYMEIEPAIAETKQLVFSKEYRVAGGDIAQAWWRRELDVLARRGWQNSANPGSDWLKKRRHNLNDSILLYKVSTVLIQFAAVFNCMAYANTTWGTKAAVDVLVETTKTIINPTYAKAYIESSPALMTRSGAGELAAEEELEALGDRKDFGAKARRIGYGLISAPDLRVAAGSQKAVEKILIKEGIENAKEEAEFYMEMMNGSSNVAYRPHVLATGEAARTYLTFSGFITNEFFTLTHEHIASGLIHEPSYKRKVAALFSIGFLMAAGLGVDEAREAVNNFLQQKEARENKHGWLFRAVMNMITTAPFAGPVIGAVVGDRTSSQPPLPRVMEKGGKGLFRLATSDNEDVQWKGLADASESALSLFAGVPGTAQIYDVLVEGMLLNQRK